MTVEDNKKWERLAILETKMDNVQTQIDKKFDDLNDKIDEYSERHISEVRVMTMVDSIEAQMNSLNRRLDKQMNIIKTASGGFITILITLIGYLVGV